MSYKVQVGLSSVVPSPICEDFLDVFGHGSPESPREFGNGILLGSNQGKQKSLHRPKSPEYCGMDNSDWDSSKDIFDLEVTKSLLYYQIVLSSSNVEIWCPCPNP